MRSNVRTVELFMGIHTIMRADPNRMYFIVILNGFGMGGLFLSTDSGVTDLHGRELTDVRPVEIWNDRHGVLCQEAWYLNLAFGPVTLYIEEVVRVYSGSGNRTKRRDEHAPVHSGSRFDQRGWDRLKQDVNLTITASRLSRGASHADIFSGSSGNCGAGD